jgi:hypothetical protein
MRLAGATARRPLEARAPGLFVRLTENDMDPRPIDADNHYYEPLDAFTRHLPKQFQRRGVRPVQAGKRVELLIADRVNRFVPNPNPARERRRGARLGAALIRPAPPDFPGDVHGPIPPGSNSTSPGLAFLDDLSSFGSADRQRIMSENLKALLAPVQ